MTRYDLHCFDLKQTVDLQRLLPNNSKNKESVHSNRSPDSMSSKISTIKEDSHKPKRNEDSWSPKATVDT